MENATDALLIAFAILICIIALTVSLSTLSQAKSTADIVLFFSDRENFQVLLKDDPENVSGGGRTVNVDTVIATIARCAKEKFSVKIDDGNKTYLFEYDVQTNAEIKQMITKFIKEHQGERYRETYVEVTTSGTTITGSDGTSLEQNVGKKIYITYKKI